MKIYPDTKIYIACPANICSGGPELCHQFASKLISFGLNAYVLYFQLGGVKFNKNDPVHDIYKKYHVPYTFSIEDKSQNILIAPETFTYYLYMIKKCRGVLWWLSVDNYFDQLIKQFSLYYRDPLCNAILKFFYFHDANDSFEHFVQSEYARQFVKFNGVPDDKIYIVGDYLNPIFLNRAAQVDLTAKRDFVAYNPKKGFEVTEYLIKSAPDIDWRPIINMTPAQVQDLLAKAKIYIDFGNHPGKDRIPREAAISGCVVITGKRGSAANDIDVNIPAEFKFDERTTSPKEVIEKIREVFENFPVAYQKQADYRARILNDKNRFDHEVAEVFDIKNSPLPSVALIQGVGEKGFLLAEELFRSENFKPSFIVDDVLASTKISDVLLLREQHRNYLRVGKNFIEIITREDAKFLYLEGRIKKFALLEPSDKELLELQKFYEPLAEDVLIFER